MKLLIANRGEIAIRVLRAAAELGIPTVAVAPKDDAGSLHTGKADEFVQINGVGVAAYLDIEQLIAVARDTKCDAVHPAYGFLSENAEFAQACTDAGLTFVGPSVETLRLCGDKAQARASAVAADVPVLRGIDHAISVADAEALFHELGDGRAMMLKAIGGGGGRGSRKVTSLDAVAPTYERCHAEALAAFGNGDLYAEEFLQQARHVEVQVIGDQHGAVTHLSERECSVQRNFQKIIEVAPAPALDETVRDEIISAAIRMAKSIKYQNAGTFEFLVDVSGNNNTQHFAFIETNARLQVEHTVTEEITGVDIVQTQLRIAQGATLKELGLATPPPIRGIAIQARVCMESVDEYGVVRPTSGTLTAYEAPSGPGIRTDGFGYSGYETNSSFDSLLAKVIGYAPTGGFEAAIERTNRALSEFRIEGLETNVGLLQSILRHPEFRNGSAHTRFLDEHLAELASALVDRKFVVPDGFEATAFVEQEQAQVIGPQGSVGLVAPMQGTLVGVDVEIGQKVSVGQTVAVIEAMKLQHDIKADQSGTVSAVSMKEGDIVREGYPIVFVEPIDGADEAVEGEHAFDLDQPRGDMTEFAQLVEGRLDPRARPGCRGASHSEATDTSREYSRAC